MPSRFASLLLATLLATAAVPAVPATPVFAVDPTGCGENSNVELSVSEDANGVDVACVIGGGGGPVTVPPVNTKPSPWCSAGYGSWAYPRYASPTTGEVVVASGTTAISSGGTAGGAGFDALYNQARIRALTALLDVPGSNFEAFYWSTAPVDVTAMILQIEPFYVKGDGGNTGFWSWRMRRMQTARDKYWEIDPVSGGSREITKIVDGTIRAEALDLGDGGAAAREYILVPTPGATRYRITSVSKADALTITGTDVKKNLYYLIGLSIGGRLGDGVLPIKSVVDRFFLPFDGWTADSLPTSPLRSRYFAADLQWPSRSKLQAAFDLVSGGNPISIGDIATLPDDAQITIYGYTPNRKPLLSSLTDDKLKAALKYVVNRNLTKKLGQGTIDDYGLPAGYDPNKYYAFPAFFAPTDPAVPSVCRRYADEFPLTNNLSVKHFVPWNTSSFNGCRTKSVYDLASFNANLPPTNGLRGSACWLNWRILPIPEQTYVWSEELASFMPQASYLPTARGAVNDAITLKAHRNSAGQVVYAAKDGLVLALPWTEDKQSTAVAKLPTYLNLTQVGISAEVGIPGQGGQVLARVGRATVAGTEYDLQLRFARTALEQLQEAKCRDLSAARLETYCGIVYDPIAKEWFYRVRLRTWYGGVYYAPDALQNEPKLRGLFNLQHTPGLPLSLTRAVPDRIRDYTWTTPYQDSAIRFATNSPRFELTGGYWTEMRNLAAGLATDGGPSDPSRPAYTYARGSYYPILDASGFNSCASGFSDGSRCFVDVYVRSRQPVTDR